MTLRWDKGALINRVRQLDARRGSLLAASTATRLVAARLAANPPCATGVREQLEIALKALWDHAAGYDALKHDLEAQLARIMQIVEADSRAGNVLGEDSAAALAYGVRYLLSTDPQEVGWALARGFEAADELASNEPGSTSGTVTGPAALANPHPLVQTELARQARDLSEIEGLGPTLSRGAIERFKLRSQAEGLKPVG